MNRTEKRNNFEPMLHLFLYLYMELVYKRMQLLQYFTRTEVD